MARTGSTGNLTLETSRSSGCFGSQIHAKLEQIRSRSASFDVQRWVGCGFVGLKKLRQRGLEGERG